MDIFSGPHFHDFAQGRREQLRSEVHAESADRLLGMDEQQYIDYLESKHKLDPIIFSMDQRTATSREVQIRAELFPTLFNVHPGKSYPKQVITVFVPYSGTEALLRVKPSQWQMRTIQVGSDSQRVSFDFIDFYADGRAGTEIQHTCDFLRDQAKNIERDVSSWNANLRTQITDVVRARKADCLKQRNSLASIGIPLLHSNSVPATFTVPVTPKRIEVPKPTAPVGTFAPDPTMSDSDYGKIIDILSEMGKALERSPSVHATQSEEGTRDYLLVALSTHYQNASGETFRQKGKTDILVPHKEGALFVAEIKVWSGPKSIEAAIDQLLSYLTWRDSKAALLILVRQQGFSEVVAQVPALLQSHSCFSSAVANAASVARFSYRMSLPQDKSRKVSMAVLLFHLPNVPEKRTRRKPKQ